MSDTFIHSLWVATALILVIEGIWPFLNPEGFRKMLIQVAQTNDQSMRIMGLVCMVIGVILLYWVN